MNLLSNYFFSYMCYTVSARHECVESVIANFVHICSILPKVFDSEKENPKLIPRG